MEDLSNSLAATIQDWPGLVCSGLVLGHHMLYVLSKLLYYIPIVCLLQKVKPLIIISIHRVLGCRGLGVRGPDPRPGVPAQQPAGELRREDKCGQQLAQGQ